MKRNVHLVNHLITKFNDVRANRIRICEIYILVYLYEKKIERTEDINTMTKNFVKYHSYPYNQDVEDSIEQSKDMHTIHVNDNNEVFLCNCKEQEYDPAEYTVDIREDLLDDIVEETLGMTSKDMIRYYHSLQEVKSVKKYSTIRL